MESQTKIVIASILTSIIVSLIVIPILKKLKVGQMERQEGPQSHLKKQGTPTMGGIIMIITILIVGTIAFFIYFNKERDVAIYLVPLILTTIGFSVIGLIDDCK